MKKTIQKIGVFAFAFALTISLALPTNASAQSISQLQAMIAQLQAQINLLTGSTPVTTFTYTRDLTLGSTGSDVVALQTFLESKGMLTIPTGVSKGYFGALTRSALARYQASVGIAPAVGYFGPITRARVNQESVVVVIPGPETPPVTGGLRGGEASLEAFDLSSGDDSDVKEGSSAEIAEIEFDVEDGDIRIDRVDLRLVADTDNEEKDPWDTFESLRLIVDGKEIGEIDLDDEDTYLDEDDGTIRISNINHIVREGDSVTIVVEITAQNSVDGADSNLATWTINIEDDGIRATDAEGIQQYIGSDSETVVFDIDEEGVDDELNVSSSSEDPNATTLKVEDDSRSDEHEIFAFDLEAGDADIEIDTVQIVLESDVIISNLISDLILEIDGEEFDDWSFVGTGTSTRTIEFDIDGDYTLDADDEITVFLIAEFKAANGTNYSSGATIRASIEDGAIEGEGADDVVSDGTARGEVHTVATEGVIVNLSSKNAKSTGTDNRVGEFTFDIDVTAFEEDVFVELSATRGTIESNTGFNLVILDGNNNVVTDGTATFSIDANEDETSNGRVEVSEGDTVEFTVTVFFDAATAGVYKAQLYSVNHNTVDLDADTQFLLVPASTYRTSSTFVEN